MAGTGLKHKVWTVTQIAVVLSAVVWAIWLLLPRVIWPDGSAAADPRAFGMPRAGVARLGSAPETGKSARRYKAMVAEGAFNGAMAMNPTGGFGWADNNARIKDAEAFAMARCKTEGPGCEIILRITPAEAVAAEGQVLSYTAAKAALAYLDQPGAKAFAVTGHGGWGGAWNRVSQAQAVEAALAGCRKHEVTQVGALWLKTECRLIWAE